MSTAIDERVDTAPASTGDDRPSIAHCYCWPCNKGLEVATSMCGFGQKSSVELRMHLGAEKQLCVLCAEMMPQACPECGS